MKKIFGFIFLLGLALGASGQTVLKKHFANTDVILDTVTNTGTNYVGNLKPIAGPAQSVVIQCNLVKQSGTQAGTITIQGSLDGTNFVAIPTNETQTAVATATATNVATQSFAWRFTGNPFPYYRVSWTGTGTMASTLAGVLIAH